MLPEIYRLPRVLRLLPVALLLASLIALLGACSGENETGPVDVRLDRDGCDHCRMVLSDPHFVAEIRYFPPGKRSRVAKFDDIGCAVTWLQDKPWKSDEKTEIWVADHRTGAWIDARSAVYVPKKSTPMDYGLGAQSEAAPGGINFEQAREKIAAVENRFNEHGLQLHNHPKHSTAE